jgi:CheY-like chemotaxis protein
MKQISILIVNDDVNSCKLFKAYCTMAGYNARSVGSAEEALSQLTTVHPDLIMLDMKLPGMSGMTFLHNLKADPFTCDIHVVVTTVYNEHYSQQQIKKAGADGFLIVPKEREQVMEVIANTISEIAKEF